MVTVTTSETAPTWSCRFTRVVSVTLTRTWGCTNSLNPVLDALTVYTPGGSSGNKNVPMEDAVVFLTSPVASLLTVTPTPTRTAPEESVAVPVSAPVLALWLRPASTSSRKARSVPRIRTSSGFTGGLLSGKDFLIPVRMLGRAQLQKIRAGGPRLSREISLNDALG